MDVGEHRGVAVGRESLQRLDAVVRRFRRDAEQAELAHQDLAVDRMIVDHEHARHRRRRAAQRIRAAPARPAAGRRGESAGAARSASVTVKVEPLPGTLSTVTLPPISSASRRTIERPRPVPPKRRVVEESACANGWNSRRRCSSLRPMPVSVTDSVTLARAFADRRVAARDQHPAALGEFQRVADEVEQDLPHARWNCRPACRSSLRRSRRRARGP